MQARGERLRHPAGVQDLQWSYAGLQQGAPQYEHLQVSNIPMLPEYLRSMPLREYANLLHIIRVFPVKVDGLILGLSLIIVCFTEHCF